MARVYHVSTDGTGDFSSVAEVNSASLAPGDEVRFRCGDVFEGTELKGQVGVTYASYGEGDKPLFQNIEGAAFAAAEDTTFRDIDVSGTTSYGVFIDYADDVKVANVEFENTSQQDADSRTIAVFHSDNVALEGNTLGTSNGLDHIFAYNTENLSVTGNDITWSGPNDGDGVQVAASSGFQVAGNTVRSYGGGKGAIEITPDSGFYPDGGVVENNLVEGGQYGISARLENVVVRENVVKNVGNQDHSADWATAIWVATGGNQVDVSGMEFYNNVVVDSTRAFGSWDDQPSYSTDYEIHNNVVVNSSESYFFRDNGSMSGGFTDNLIVNSGSRSVSVNEAEWQTDGNYFYDVAGQSDSGAAPELNADYMPAGNVRDVGLTTTFEAGAQAWNSDGTGDSTQDTATEAPDDTADPSPGDGNADGGDSTNDASGTDGTTDNSDSDGGDDAGSGEPTSTHQLNVRLGGEAWNGAPQYVISVDGEEIATGEVDWAMPSGTFDPANSEHWQTLSFDLPAGADPEAVAVEFTNDAYGGSGQDRNLWVDSVEIDGQRVEAEGDQTAYGDRSGQEAMAWNGTMSFNVAGLASEDTGTEAPDDTADPSPGGDQENVKPTVTADTGKIGESDRISIDPEVLLADDSDPDGDPLSIVDVTATDETRGSVAFGADSESILYDTDGVFDHLVDGETTTDSFQYTVADGQGGTATGSVSMTVVGQDSAEQQETSIGVRLAGQSWQGDPHYQILGDGTLLDEGTVDWSKATDDFDPNDPEVWRTIETDLGEASPPSSVEVVFDNDAYGGSGQDRNLWVDWVDVNGQAYEAEGPHASGGLAGEEVLPWNQTLELDTSDAPEPEELLASDASSSQAELVTLAASGGEPQPDPALDSATPDFDTV